ncbi:FG-GAP-like repeat-containing protein [Streptomyces sp. NPDC056501]|uniref:FG-GAP-like repeat-containing protein n=1 Tax=Streptomyces sp. NPDC056501 TaxID=3345841 RepID=UPI003686E4E4
MKGSSAVGRRHTVAIAVALATTGGLTAPALAAGPAVPSVSAQATVEAMAGEGVIAPLTVPADSVLISAGRTGMLTRSGTGSGIVHRWTRHADGVTTVLPGRAYWGSPGEDLVVTQAGAVFTLTDMSETAEPVVIDTSAFNTAATPYQLQRVVGRTLVMTAEIDGVWQHRLVSWEAGKVVDRKVAVPDSDSTWLDHTAGPETLAVVHRRADYSSRSLSVVDLATGALTETYALKAETDIASVTLTPTHVAWVENPYSVDRRLVVVPRGTNQAQPVTLNPPGYANDTVLQALGDWLAYVKPGGSTATSPNGLHPLTVRSVKTGETFPLLDHATSLVPDANGDLLAVGGTLAHGEGLYRIALDETTGKPAATLVRTAGLPTALAVLQQTLPPTGTFDFDRAGGKLTAGWTLSRFNAKATLTLTHTASGRTVKIVNEPREGVTDIPLTWDGRYADGLPAYNGAYNWTMTATPSNGIGPAVERKGSFTLTRAPRPHDYDNNGSPDILARHNGYLAANDVRQIWSLKPFQGPHEIEIGGGWNTYDRIITTGHIGGSRGGDLVARDKSGVLWFYEGKEHHKTPFATRTRIGGGWQIYRQITGGSDVTGDGRNDVLATDKTGVLWLYPGTGNSKTPFTARKRIGGGWGFYNQLTATGNLAGGPAGDLVTRDTQGGLWLYLGKGNGTFAPRTRVGGGWGPFKTLIGIGDVNGDGRNDLLAEGSDPATDDTVLHLYNGTGDWKAPFTSPQTDTVEQRAWIGDLF